MRSLGRCRIAIVLCLLVILVLAFLHIQNAREIIFRNGTGVGLTKEDVLRKAGRPNAIITKASELDRPPFNTYDHSHRPMTAEALVYFRFGEMIVVYLDDRDYVMASYWGARR